MRYGKFFTDNTTDVEDIMVTTDGGEYTDAVLRADKWFPIETVGDVGSSNTIIRYTLIRGVDDSNDSNDSNDISDSYIEERYIAQPPPTKSYSKLKILLAAQNAGMGDAFVGLLQSNATLKLIWDASNVIEDNELLDQYLPDIATALDRTTDEIKAFLDENCAVD